MSIDRKNFPILVSDAQTTAALGCLRSLARAGFPVHIMGEQADMLCFASRWATQKCICPPYSSKEFPGWVLNYIREHQICLILPTERFLLALRDRLPEILPYLHARVSLETLERSLSKTRLFRSFEMSSDLLLRENLPPFKVFDLETGTRPAIESLDNWRGPYFVKCDSLESRNFSSSTVERVEKLSELPSVMDRLSATYRTALVQDFAPGRGAGAFLLRWNNQLVANFMHDRLHEVPYTGGYSSLRSAHQDKVLMSDAQRRAEFLKWDGPAMFEYRQDPQTRNFQLMELNARFWGSLHLALYAGVDFPRMLADLARGVSVDPQINNYNLKCTARLAVPADIQHTWSVMKAKEFSAPQKVVKMLEFFWLFLKPGVRDDLLYPGDRRVFFVALKNYILQFFNRPN